MGLTDDQKAMLRLLAQREEGYEDMAALMGVSVEEVRVRVKEALAEVEETGEVPEPEPDPTPPPAPAPVEAPAPPEPEPAAAPTPASPPAAKASPKQQSPRANRPSIPSLKLPQDRGALIGLGAGALVVVILVVILLVGGDGDSGSGDASSAGDTSNTAAVENSNLTQAVLEPTDGGDASGRALFGRYRKNVLLQVEAEGLEPSPAGETYTIWLYRSPNLVLRIGAVKVGEEGKLAVQLPVPAQVLAYVAGGAFDQVDISLTPTAAYRAELAKAKREQRLPKYTGESVLRGEITGPAIR